MIQNRYILQAIYNNTKDQKLSKQIVDIENKFDNKFVNGSGIVSKAPLEDLDEIAEIKKHKAKMISHRENFTAKIDELSVFLFQTEEG